MFTSGVRPSPTSQWSEQLRGFIWLTQISERIMVVMPPEVRAAEGLHSADTDLRQNDGGAAARVVQLELRKNLSQLFGEIYMIIGS